MTSAPIAIIGSTGKTGARVQARLQAKGLPTRGLARQGDHPFDWQRPDQWYDALKGTRSAYITYFPDLALPKAQSDIALLVETARQAGLNHLVLLSGRGEDGAVKAEQQVQSSGLTWNVIRASWFMQNFSESFMADGITQGQLVLPEPKAEEPFIDIDDIADVAVAALTQPQLHNQLFEVTGPELLSFAHCVSRIAQVLTKPIEFHPVPVEDYLAYAEQQADLPDGFGWLIHELFTQVLDGRNESTTDTVAKILGRRATSFDQYIEKTTANGLWQIPPEVTSA